MDANWSKNLPAEFQQSISNVSATKGGKVFAGVHIHGTDCKSRHQNQKFILMLDIHAQLQAEPCTRHYVITLTSSFATQIRSRKMSPTIVAYATFVLPTPVTIERES